MSVGQDVVLTRAANARPDAIPIFPPGLTLTLAASSCGFVVVLLDITIVNVALPSIGAALGGGAENVGLQQWIVDAYALAMASLMLSGGALGDRYGSRLIFELGLALFGVASVTCAVAPSVAILIGGRALQGCAAALVLPASLAIITHACRGDAQLRTRAIGLWSSVGGLVSAAGPALGGALVLGWGWPAIFWINLPFCFLGVLLSRFHGPDVASKSRRPLDVAGNLWALVLFAALTSTVLEAGTQGIGSPMVVIGLGVALGAGVGFWRSQRRAIAPVLPLPLLKHRATVFSLLIGLLANLAFYGMIFVLSHYFQRGRGYSPLAAGFALTPFVIVMAGNIASARLGARWGARLPVRLGLAITWLGYVYAALLLAVFPDSPYLGLLPALLLMAFGGGITIPALTSYLLGYAEADRYGAVSAVFNTSRQLGAALGVAILGGFVGGTAVLSGVASAFGFSSVLLLLCAACAWRLPQAKAQ